VIAWPRGHLPAAGYSALALGTFALVFFGFRTSPTTVGGQGSDVAPTFELDALGGGGSIDFAAYSGRTVVLNFWAAWCGPCKDEAASLERAWKRWSGRDVEFVGIDTRDSIDAGRAFVDAYGITYPIAVDPAGQTANAYGVTGMPQTFLISSDGRLVRRAIGPLTEGSLNDLLQSVAR
jgi:cytochrome c biogenesis protein CcmG/thiol:disulfide interchange protein DsbE